MPLSRIEIRRRAISFAKEWADAADEDAEDWCCRTQPFASDAKRVEYLFEMYEKYTSWLLAVVKPKRTKSDNPNN